jgi:hypothetical protein
MITGVAADAAGGAVVSGSFFGSLVAGSDTWISAGSEDGFVMRVSPAGEVVWSRVLAGPGQDRALAVALDPSGRAFVSGFYHAPLDLGQGPLFDGGTASVPFVAAFDSGGKLDFVHAFSDADTLGGYAFGVGVRPSGRAVAILDPSINGQLVRVVTIDPAIKGPSELLTYTSDNQIYGRVVTADPAGNVLCAGYFKGVTDLGSGPLSSGDPWSQAMFIAKTAPASGDGSE